jgi:hypothetical protein
MNHFHTEEGGQDVDFTADRTLNWFALLRYFLIGAASVAASVLIGAGIAQWWVA